MERLSTRVGNLDRHFGQAAKDIEEIKISAERAGSRARRLEAIDFAPTNETDPDAPNLTRLSSAADRISESGT